MTLETAAVLVLLAISLYPFVSEKLRMDMVARQVLEALAASGWVTTTEVLAGFRNPAVETVRALFILSADLSATGFAASIGSQMLRFAGTGEPRIHNWIGNGRFRGDPQAD